MKRLLLPLLLCLVTLALFSCGAIKPRNHNSNPHESGYEASDITDETSKEELIPYIRVFGEYDMEFDYTKYLDILGEKYGQAGNLIKGNNDDYEFYVGSFDNPYATERDSLSIPCRIIIYDNSQKAKEYFKEEIAVYHPALKPFESIIRIGKVVYQGYSGFVADVAGLAGIEVPETVNVKRNETQSEITLNCSSESLVSALTQKGCTFYKSNWVKIDDDRYSSTVEPYVCITPSGQAFVINICNPVMSSMLINIIRNVIRDMEPPENMLDVCYYYTYDGIVIMGTKPYIYDLIDLING